MSSVPRRRCPGAALFLAFFLAIGGCTFNGGTLTALATHNVNIPVEPLQRGVEGEDCIYFVFGLPVSGSLIPNLQEAEDNAIAQSPEGNAMQDVALYVDQMSFLVGNSVCYRVRGDIVRIAPSAVQSGSEGARQ